MEIQRADRRLRFIVSLAFLGAVAIGAVGLVALEDWLDAARHLAPAQAKRSLLSAFAWLSGTACVSTLLMGLYLWRVGARVRAAAQFPLPGARVIRDTAVLRGAVASRRGKVLQGVGAVLVLCALGLFAASWFLYSALFTHTA
jgi:hypothetical protein